MLARNAVTLRLKRPPHRQLRTPEDLEPDPKAYVAWSSQPLTAFETHNGRSTFDAGTALHAPYLPFAILAGTGTVGWKAVIRSPPRLAECANKQTREVQLSASAPIARQLTDHLIRAAEHGERDSKTERVGDFEVDMLYFRG